MDKPDYEQALVTSLKMYAKPKMTVVIGGGGISVKLTGAQGKVICYEESQINVGRIRETTKRMA